MDVKSFKKQYYEDLPYLVLSRIYLLTQIYYCVSKLMCLSIVPVEYLLSSLAFYV